MRNNWCREVHEQDALTRHCLGTVIVFASAFGGSVTEARGLALELGGAADGSLFRVRLVSNPIVLQVCPSQMRPPCCIAGPEEGGV